FQAEDGIRDFHVTGVQTCALPISYALRVDAARALANVDDPRARPALRAAYERAVEDEERVLLGGALGATGDQRAAAFVRALLPRAEPPLRLLALQALEHLGDDSDVDAVLARLGEGDTPETWQAVRTLGCLGDRRGLEALAALYARTRIPGLLAEIEEADGAIRARLELRGETPAAPIARVSELELTPA